MKKSEAIFEIVKQKRAYTYEDIVAVIKQDFPQFFAIDSHAKSVERGIFKTLDHALLADVRRCVQRSNKLHVNNGLIWIISTESDIKKMQRDAHDEKFEMLKNLMRKGKHLKLLAMLKKFDISVPCWRTFKYENDTLDSLVDVLTRTEERGIEIHASVPSAIISKAIADGYNFDERAAIWYAAQRGAYETVKLLLPLSNLRKKIPTITDKGWRKLNPLEAARDSGDTKMVALIEAYMTAQDERKQLEKLLSPQRRKKIASKPQAES